mmetsp:Transcript_11074/g.34304  ORF Transcript_11074/g.34304 Transcript_11074/m.34304 type:complete len:278 (-) Transcript_11074:22-855(-)
MMRHSASTMDWYCLGSLMRTSALSFSALSSSSTFRHSTVGFVNFFGCCSKPAYEKVFLKATPSTRMESRIEPPVTFLMPMRSRFTSSSSVRTASTAILPKNSRSEAISLELSAVCAQRWRSTDCASFCSANGMASSSSRRVASSTALRKDLMITCAGMPSSILRFASLSSSPVSTMTDVVPSPTSWSCARAMSTRQRAAGWTISSSWMTVAPSLLMLTWPRSFCTSLSMPHGPRVVFTVSTMFRMALMLLISCGLPCEVSVPSRSKMSCGCIASSSQ